MYEYWFLLRCSKFYLKFSSISFKRDQFKLITLNIKFTSLDLIFFSMNNLDSLRATKSSYDIKRKLMILGCEGHSKVATDIAESVGFHNICYEDPYRENNTFLNRKVYKSIKENYKDYYFVAIGDNFLREKVSRQFSIDNKEAELLSLIHPSSIISSKCSIGIGTIIMPLCAINSYSKLGNGVIINTNSIIEHDAHLMDFSSLAPGVTIGGYVSIGKRSAVSIGASVIHNINIGNDVVVGASSLVMKDIGDNQVAYGLPAKCIRERKAGEKYL